MSEQAPIQQLARLVDNAPLPFWISQGDGRVLAANQGFRTLAGPGEDLHELMLPSQAVDSLLKALADHPDEMTEAEVALARSADRSARMTATASIVELAGDRLVMGWLSSQEDQTANPEWLINQIAHALRNPIFAASVQAEASSLRATEMPEIAKPVGILFRQLKRLEAEIDEMLLLGRPVKLSPQPVEVQKLLSMICEIYRQGQRREAAEVILQIDTPDLKATWDTRSVQLILERLLDNAVEHTEAPHQILLAARLVDTRIVLVISDQGAGIAEDIRDKIFLPFFPQHRGRPGLGLAIAKKYLQVIGGQLEVCSEPGKGTEVTCTLPITMLQVPET
jgi:signal transduction histidine kinase